MKFTAFLPAIAWLIASVFLLVLPGDDLPHSRFFDIPYFDKYVHFGMFALLTILFCYPFAKYSHELTRIISAFNKIVLVVVFYGILMEFVQRFLSNGRSFDLTDIIFDTLGALAGLFAIRQFAWKKIGPDGNQGRNQN